jgi:hypothetical protein
LILWKIKNYDEIYIGQFEVDPADFFDCDVVQEYQKKIIKEKSLEKDVFKRINGVSVCLGQISFKIIILCASNIPQSCFES